MAFLSGIFNKAPAQQAPAAAPAPTGGPVAAQQAGPANPSADPANMQNQPAQPAAGGPVNPLDQFSSLFQPKPVDPKAPKAPSLSDPYLGPLDPAAFRQQVDKANFTANIQPEIMQKALAGDQEAFASVINSAAREAFAAAAQLSHGLVEHGVRTGAERFNGALDSRIKNYQIRSQNSTNEALQHPSVAPMMNAVKMQIAQSNPQLSPEAVQAQAEQYFTQMSEVLLAPKLKAQEQAARPKETDFSSYL